MKADCLENCNCDLLCPCLFAVKPTYGDCHVPIAHHMREGHDGHVRYPPQGATGIPFEWPKPREESSDD